MLLNRHGDRVLRVKGILNVADAGTPVAIHGVQRLVHPPVHMAAWPDDDRRSRLVFIVDGLDRGLIERSLRRSFRQPRRRVLPLLRPVCSPPCSCGPIARRRHVMSKALKMLATVAIMSLPLATHAQQVNSGRSAVLRTAQRSLHPLCRTVGARSHVPVKPDVNGGVALAKCHEGEPPWRSRS